MEADFDIDAAFDEVVDRFVSEYVPVMKKIDAIDGLPDKVKSAWKNILLTVQKPGELQVATRRDLSPSALSSLLIWDTSSDLRDAIIKMNGSVNHKIVE